MRLRNSYNNGKWTTQTAVVNSFCRRKQCSENLADQSVSGRQSASRPFIQTLSIAAEVEATYKRAGLVIFYLFIYFELRIVTQ